MGADHAQHVLQAAAPNYTIIDYKRYIIYLQIISAFVTREMCPLCFAAAYVRPRCARDEIARFWPAI